MKVVYTPAHLRHDPHVEFETSRAHSPWEHIGRAEAIRETLQADDRFQFQAPSEWGTDPIEAVHNPGLVKFLSEGWALYAERLMEEYLSHHWRAIGRTTKQQKSRSLRKVSGHESYPAQHSTQCCTDICRGDNLIWDPIQDRPVSVEIGSMMSTPSRVVTAMRLFPRSANGVDVGLLREIGREGAGARLGGERLEPVRAAGDADNIPSRRPKRPHGRLADP